MGGWTPLPRLVFSHGGNPARVHSLISKNQFSDFGKSIPTIQEIYSLLSGNPFPHFGKSKRSFQKIHHIVSGHPFPRLRKSIHLFPKIHFFILRNPFPHFRITISSFQDNQSLILGIPLLVSGNQSFHFGKYIQWVHQESIVYFFGKLIIFSYKWRLQIINEWDTVTVWDELGSKWWNTMAHKSTLDIDWFLSLFWIYIIILLTQHQLRLNLMRSR